MEKAVQPRVFIVTPIFNRREHTIEFLKTVFENSYINFTMVIVDDGSTDGSAELIKKKYPKTVVLPGTGNMYWTGATNMGVAYALEHGADYVITVNNDVEVSSSWIDELVKCAQANPKSLVGSLIYFMDDRKRVWYSGADFDFDKGDIYHLEQKPKNDRPLESKWLTGMGVLIPIETFKKIGLYDQKSFPQYFADADFSLRAAQAGYRLLVAPKAILYNDASSDSGGKLMRDYRLGAVPKILLKPYFNDSIKIRYRFYKRYFGDDYKKHLRKYYRQRWKTFYSPYVRYSIRLKLISLAKKMGIKRK